MLDSVLQEMADLTAPLEDLYAAGLRNPRVLIGQQTDRREHRRIGRLWHISGLLGLSRVLLGLHGLRA